MISVIVPPGQRSETVVGVVAQTLHVCLPAARFDQRTDPATIQGNVPANIQGKVFGGCSGDYQGFLFLQFQASVPYTRAWVAQIANDVATSEEGLLQDAGFGVANARHKREGALKATRLELALSFNGLQALGIPEEGLAGFPLAFRKGMAGRTQLIGDGDASASSDGVRSYGLPGVHALLHLASDDPRDLAAEVAFQRRMLSRADIRVVFQQHGRTCLGRPGEAGHTHADFKDGISRPGKADQPARPVDTVPAWARDSSYLVFRWPEQDVDGFKRRASSRNETTPRGECFFQPSIGALRHLAGID